MSGPPVRARGAPVQVRNSGRKCTKNAHLRAHVHGDWEAAAPLSGPILFAGGAHPIQVRKAAVSARKTPSVCA